MTTKTPRVGGEKLNMANSPQLEKMGWKREFIKFRTKIMSEMLDNPNNYGIYGTTKFYNNLDDYVFKMVEKAIQSEREKVVNMIADNEGWEESRKFYLEKLSNTVLDTTKRGELWTN